VNHIFGAFGRDTNISKLNLSNNVFYNSGIIRLESALSENIKLMELNLSHCKMGEIGGKTFTLFHSDFSKEKFLLWDCRKILHYKILF